MSAITLVVTDYGDVRLSAKTRAWITKICGPDYWDVYTETDGRKRRSKKYKTVVEAIKRLENAASLRAEIEWFSGGVLDEF